MTETPGILIVDDDVRICRTLRSYLKREGYSVKIAADGADMWHAIDAFTPDLVLLDVSEEGPEAAILAPRGGRRHPVRREALQLDLPYRRRCGEADGQAGLPKRLEPQVRDRLAESARQLPPRFVRLRI